MPAATGLADIVGDRHDFAAVALWHCAFGTPIVRDPLFGFAERLDYSSSAFQYLS